MHGEGEPSNIYVMYRALAWEETPGETVKVHFQPSPDMDGPHEHFLEADILLTQPKTVPVVDALQPTTFQLTDDNHIPIKDDSFEKLTLTKMFIFLSTMYLPSLIFSILTLYFAASLET